MHIVNLIEKLCGREGLFKKMYKVCEILFLLPIFVDDRYRLVHFISTDNL